MQLIWKWMGLFLKKNLYRCRDCFAKLVWGCYIVFIANTASKEIRALICSLEFLSPEVAHYLYKSTIRLTWNTVVMSGLVLLAATSQGPRPGKSLNVMEFYFCLGKFWNKLLLRKCPGNVWDFLFWNSLKFSRWPICFSLDLWYLVVRL